MRVDVARTLDGALDLLAERPETELICGGTDLMVEINFGRKRPESVIAIDRVAELRALPVLAALDARVHLRSKRGARVVPFTEFMTGPKKNIRVRDELVIAVEWDDAGPAQVFMKVGTRNAMVIAVAGLALVADRENKRIGVGLGS